MPAHFVECGSAIILYVYLDTCACSYFKVQEIYLSRMLQRHRCLLFQSIIVRSLRLNLAAIHTTTTVSIIILPNMEFKKDYIDNEIVYNMLHYSPRTGRYGTTFYLYVFRIRCTNGCFSKKKKKMPICIPNMVNTSMVHLYRTT